ncbi:uncharacterized protein BXZ73DRAFT_100206 [Epithele typhae]|uniref:uncharacterized protein n=1 Tax=Epithele typhae TaxID=378194 RepID=UPI0020086361|nr:uncharacterized protein BXZ73DRAFT_100206 [Epithele typhae]KAH9936782.1 hypothetical protein BXZ73DRAFT_100206 [Epithele typhae]
MDVALRRPSLPWDVLYHIASQCDSDSIIHALMNTCRYLNEHAVRFLQRAREARVRVMRDLHRLAAFLRAQGQTRWRYLNRLHIRLWRGEGFEPKEQVQALLDLLDALGPAPALRELTFYRLELYLPLNPAIAVALSSLPSVRTIKLISIGPNTLRFLAQVPWAVNHAFLDLSPYFLHSGNPLSALHRLLFRYLHRIRGTLWTLHLNGARNGMFAGARDVENLQFPMLQWLRLVFATNREHYSFARELPNAIALFPNLLSLAMHDSDDYQWVDIHYESDEDEDDEARDDTVPDDFVDANGAWQDEHGSWGDLKLLDAPLWSVYGLALRSRVDTLRTGAVLFDGPQVRTKLAPVLEALSPRVLALRVQGFDVVDDPGFVRAFEPERVPRLEKLDLRFVEEDIEDAVPQRAVISLLNSLEKITERLSELKELSVWLNVTCKSLPEQNETREDLLPGKVKVENSYVDVVATWLSGFLGRVAGAKLSVQVSVRWTEDHDGYAVWMDHMFDGKKDRDVVTVWVRKWTAGSGYEDL